MGLYTIFAEICPSLGSAQGSVLLCLGQSGFVRLLWPNYSPVHTHSQQCWGLDDRTPPLPSGSTAAQWAGSETRPGARSPAHSQAPWKGVSTACGLWSGAPSRPCCAALQGEGASQQGPGRLEREVTEGDPKAGLFLASVICHLSLIHHLSHLSSITCPPSIQMPVCCLSICVQHPVEVSSLGSLGRGEAWLCLCSWAAGGLRGRPPSTQLTYQDATRIAPVISAPCQRGAWVPSQPSLSPLSSTVTTTPGSINGRG